MTDQTRSRHCENCGSTSVEDLDYGDQGYTACCNELVCSGGGSITRLVRFDDRDDRRVTGCCAYMAEDAPGALTDDERTHWTGSHDVTHEGRSW